MSIHPTERGYFITYQITRYDETEQKNAITMKHPSEWLIWYKRTYGNHVVLLFWNALSLDHYKNLKPHVNEQ